MGSDGASSLSAVEQLTFDEPQRVAVQHEVFEDDDTISDAQWVEERDTVLVNEITFGNQVVAFANTETSDCMVVSANNFITAWTEDINA